MVSSGGLFEIPAAGGYTKVNALPGSSYSTGVAVDGTRRRLLQRLYPYTGDGGDYYAMFEIPSNCVASNCVKTLISVGYITGLAVDGAGTSSSPAAKAC